jgi:hypothetical protein
LVFGAVAAVVSSKVYSWVKSKVVAPVETKVASVESAVEKKA